MFKKIFISIISTIVLAGTVIIFQGGSRNINAGAGDNVSGFTWSENIGWISFNSTNCDNNGNGYIDTNAITPGCGGADNSSTPVVNYGVNINASTGAFSGYAWSENIGSIDFAPAGSYPGSPNYSACLDFSGSGQTCDGLGNNKIGGWARACGVFQTNCSGDLKPDSERGGWDGWIKLRGSNYGVDYNQQSGDLSGFGWGSDVIGWVSFNRTNCDANGDGFSEGTPAGCPAAGLPVANYKVSTTAKQPPSVGTAGETWAYCDDSLHPTLNWTYVDGTQKSYQIQMNRGSANFNNPTYDTGEVLGSGQSYATTQSFDWDQKYYWRVRAKNQQDVWSNWSNTANFITPKHAYPQPDFSYTPSNPTMNKNVNFSDKSTAFGGAEIEEWSWIFQSGNPATSTAQNPTVKFTSAGSKTVTLGVKDSDGYECGISDVSQAAQQTINVAFPLPKWKEIIPR